jgi:outer membrane protein assembly factor BamE (lipoprotein component of BamABCDE complex)
MNTTKAIAAVYTALVANAGCKSAVKFLSPTSIVKATWQNRIYLRAGCTRRTVLVTFGRPNYLERKFILKCKQANEAFPVKRIQLKFYPKKK